MFPDLSYPCKILDNAGPERLVGQGTRATSTTTRPLLKHNTSAMDVGYSSDPRPFNLMEWMLKMAGMIAPHFAGTPSDGDLNGKWTFVHEFPITGNVAYYVILLKHRGKRVVCDVTESKQIKATNTIETRHYEWKGRYTDNVLIVQGRNKDRRCRGVHSVMAQLEGDGNVLSASFQRFCITSGRIKNDLVKIIRA
jgi:hypothetical protein